MIDSIHLENFKAHKDTRIPLQRLTALVGPNSSGKTSVLQGMFIIHRLMLHDITDTISGRWAPDVIARKGSNDIELRLSGNDGPIRWRLSFEAESDSTSPNRLTWTYHFSYQEQDHAPLPTSIPIQETETLGERVPISVKASLDDALLLKFDSRLLAEPSYSPYEVPFVEADGGGLASVVAYLKTYQDEVFDELLSAVQAVIPQVKRIRVRKAKIHKTKVRQISFDGGRQIPFSELDVVVGDELVFDMVGAKNVPAHAVSEGTLLVVGLLTVLVSQKVPKVVLMEDVEQGLHPKAQREFIEVLRKLQEEKKDLQIVMTTHSPYIVDELSEKEVIVMATDEEGIVHAQCLTDHPDAEKALEVLTTGEFLSAEGEDWVLNVEKTS